MSQNWECSFCPKPARRHLRSSIPNARKPWFPVGESVFYCEPCYTLYEVKMLQPW